MDEAVIAERLSRVEERSKSNTKRIDSLEAQTSAINELATSTAVLAEQVGQMGNTLSKVSETVDELKAEPGNRWKFVVEKVIYIVVAAVLGFALAHVGL